MFLAPCVLNRQQGYIYFLKTTIIVHMMKTRKFIGKMLMLMSLVGMTACNNMENPVEIPKENDVHDFSKAIGVTWQLYGFGTVGEDEIQKAKPEKGDKEWRKGEQYTISFNEDGTLEGHTFSNDLHVSLFTVHKYIVVVGFSIKNGSKSTSVISETNVPLITGIVFCSSLYTL